MTLEISYFGRATYEGAPIAGNPIAGSSQSLALTATPASSTATPGNAVYMSVVATETLRFEYGPPTPTTTATSHYMALGERLWLQPVAGSIFSARTS